MSLGTVIKENRVFVAGVTLPLILILLFTLAKLIPLADPPQYKAVFWTKSWSQKGNLSFAVTKEHVLQVTYTINKDFVATANYNGGPVTADIYIFDPVTNITTKEAIKLSDKDTVIDQWADFPSVVETPKLSTLKISANAISPDGYVFEPYSYGHSSLLTDVFGGYRHHSPSIGKNGRHVRLTDPQGGYINNPEFIGWVIEGTAQ
ncbi:MAG: hypothetical protein AAB276_09915 [Pseudomonadota bacterium]